jgi:rod shape-determining protein MreC
MFVPDRRSSRRILVGSLSLVLASFITLMISTQSLTGVSKQLGLTVLSFFQQGFSTVGSFVSDTIYSIAELRRLEESHRNLLAQVESLGRMEREFTDLKQENDRLRQLLKLSSEASYSSVAARIIAKDPGNLYSTFILDKGASHGIRKNQAVIAYQDGLEGLVGRVIEVSRATCLVIPIFDSASYIGVRMDRSRYEGLAMGSGSEELPLVVQYVKKRARDEIQYGDLVITSGLQSLYPAGIKVGRVSKLRLLDYLTSMELEIEPIIDFSRIEYVFVISEDHTSNASISGGDS